MGVMIGEVLATVEPPAAREEPVVVPAPRALDPEAVLEIVRREAERRERLKAD